MTLENIPLAIDGALTPSSLFRKGLLASIGGAGVVGSTDFTVSASSPAGQSLRVSPGLAVVENGYQTDPDEVYVVSNLGIHNVTSGEMPGSSGSTTYWMVCAVVGDPNPAYSQTGHPYMPSDFDEEQANTFEYNRIVVLACLSTDTTFEDLGNSYPGLALARLAIPPSTTTITSGMITDLRVKAGADEIVEITPSGDASPTGTGNVTVPGLSKTVTVLGPLDKFVIDIDVDVQVAAGVINIVELLDGATPHARTLQTGSNLGGAQASRTSGHKRWVLTGLSAGNHTFTVRTRNSIAGDATVYSTHTVMTVERKA